MLFVFRLSFLEKSTKIRSSCHFPNNIRISISYCNRIGYGDYIHFSSLFSVFLFDHKYLFWYIV